jgi:hypothetical protein
MRLKTLALALLLFGLLTAGAEGATRKTSGPHRYSPKQGHHCKRGYRRVKHRHKVLCIKRRHKKPAPKTTASEKVKLHAHLDPTYTRDPLNPFKVTYDYSASATQEPVAAASASSEAPAPLPSGVLAFYSDGKLECAINVGGAIDSSVCPVTYTALGNHTVTTIYSSGEQSATETEVEHIAPLPTTTTLSVTYEPLKAPVPVPDSSWEWVGDLAITWGAEPSAVSAHVDCGEEPSQPFGVVTASGCYRFNGVPEHEHVYEWPGGCDEATNKGVGPVYISSSFTDPNPAAQIPAKKFEDGAYHLRASVAAGSIGGSSVANAGYLPSEATAPLQFAPEIKGQCSSSE